MERLRERIEAASRAYRTFKEVIVDQATIVERDAAIKRFEYTVETTWKACQRYLEVVHGQTSGSPKTCIRMAREVGLLTDREAAEALSIVDDRNLTSHAYNEALADAIYKKFADHASVLGAWIDKMRTGLDCDTGQ